jgi:hypothetical protein
VLSQLAAGAEPSRRAGEFIQVCVAPSVLADDTVTEEMMEQDLEEVEEGGPTCIPDTQIYSSGLPSDCGGAAGIHFESEQDIMNMDLGHYQWDSDDA